MSSKDQGSSICKHIIEPQMVQKKSTLIYSGVSISSTILKQKMEYIDKPGTGEVHNTLCSCSLCFSFQEHIHSRDRC